MPAINLLAHSYKMPEDQFCAMELINMYPIINQQAQGGKSDILLVSDPGYSVYQTLSGTIGIRGMLSHDDVLYVITENSFYTINTSGTATLRGTINTYNGHVSLIANGTQIMITDGTNGYVYTPATTTLAQITDIDFPATAPSTLTYQDGYAAFVVQSTNTLYLSDLDDFSSYSSLLTTGISSVPNRLVGCISHLLELWLFTDNRAEIWSNTGASPFPFERRSNSLINMGLKAPKSLLSLSDRLIWLSQSEYGHVSLTQAQGYNISTVSDEAFNSEIQTYDEIEDAFAFSYSDRGHVFYQITFPTPGITWCLDTSNGILHKKTSRNVFGTFGRHFANCYAYFNNKHLVGGYNSNTIYEMSPSFFDENGTPMEREVIFRTISEEQKRMTCSYLQLDMQVGVGLTTGQGSDPQVMLQYSKDGGKTYSAELWRSAGPIGEYSRRVKWNRHGESRNYTWRIRMTDPVKWGLFNIIVGIKRNET